LIFFPASNPCGSIEAPFFRASHALAVDDGGGRAGLAFGLLATLFVERVMDAIQRAIDAPIAEITIDGAAQRKILGKITPLASRAQHVHDGVERLSHVCFASAASAPRWRNERFDMRPLLIRRRQRKLDAVGLARGSRGEVPPAGSNSPTSALARFQPVAVKASGFTAPSGMIPGSLFGFSAWRMIMIFDGVIGSSG